MIADIAKSSVAFFFGLVLLAVPPARAVNLQPGDAAPDFTLADIDGKIVTLSDYRGKLVLVAFWSTWCSRCSEELTFLRDNFGGRDDVAVLLINQDSEKMAPRQRIAEMRDSLALPFPVIMDTGLALWDRFGINALPTSVVVGRDGRVLYAEPNFHHESPEKLLMAVSPDSSLPGRGVPPTRSGQVENVSDLFEEMSDPEGE